MADKLTSFFIRCSLVFVVALYGLGKFFPWNIIGAIALSFLYGRWTLNRHVTKRNNAFLNSFPDALDMIVRSVRSGYPMNSAVRMVADNMQPPVSTEFKQLADEIAYGSTLIEALQRLSQRIDEPDLHFFVVVLTVQQDIGGNLSEVLNNLAGIIRKRKHLRMKIKALSSEGRTTAWVLGSMPFVEAALISTVSPNHLAPLFNTELGHTMLGITIGVVALGAFVVTRMVNIKV
jgi:tight adherence protein B